VFNIDITKFLPRRTRVQDTMYSYLIRLHLFTLLAKMTQLTEKTRLWENTPKTVRHKRRKKNFLSQVSWINSIRSSWFWFYKSNHSLCRNPSFQYTDRSGHTWLGFKICTRSWTKNTRGLMMHLLVLANLKSIPYMKARPSHLKLSSPTARFLSFLFFFAFLNGTRQNLFGWRNHVI